MPARHDNCTQCHNGRDVVMRLESAVAECKSNVGRPEATSHGAIEAAAFELFAEKGFDATTIDDIARAVGVSRRTLFRYYPSKNDIPWGQFDGTLDHFRNLLAEMPTELPLREAVLQGVLEFNDFPHDAQPPHRDRMRLILETPTLQAHSVLRYGQWRAVIAEYVAQRLNLEPDAVLPVAVGHSALACALAAYECWLRDPESSIIEHIASAAGALRQFALTQM